MTKKSATSEAKRLIKYLEVTDDFKDRLSKTTNSSEARDTIFAFVKEGEKLNILFSTDSPTSNEIALAIKDIILDGHKGVQKKLGEPEKKKIVHKTKGGKYSTKELVFLKKLRKNKVKTKNAYEVHQQNSVFPERNFEEFKKRYEGIK